MTPGRDAVRGHARRPARAAVVAVTAAVAGLVLAGCAPPDGIDGDLTGGWRELAEPVGWVPEVGACHPRDYQQLSSLHGYTPVDCGVLHRTETAHVGEFTGDAADRVTPPPAASPEWREAYAACDEAAVDYLGRDFRDGLLWLGVTVPSVAAWEGGARWFRCELVQYDVDGDSGFQGRSSSLAGALAERDSDLRLGCYQVTATEDGETVAEWQPVACDEPHNSEYVGVWRAPDVPYLDPDDEDGGERIHRGCRERVATYADVPEESVLFRAGTIADPVSEQEWDNGDRGIRCYLWVDEGELTESVRGAGTSGLPVR